MTRKTARMYEVEARYGEPLESLLPRLYDEHGTHQAVGREIGASPEAIISWLNRLGAKRYSTLKVSFPDHNGANV